MLKGISPSISPELLKILAEMGHGDTIVLGDCNYPAVTTGNRVVRADGVKATDLLKGIMKILPLDYAETKTEGGCVTLMKSDDHPDMVPEVWGEFKDIIEKYEPNATYAYDGRLDFYNKAKKAFACVQTSEEKYFGCIILRKGVWFTENEK